MDLGALPAQNKEGDGKGDNDRAAENDRISEFTIGAHSVAV